MCVCEAKTESKESKEVAAAIKGFAVGASFVQQQQQKQRRATQLHVHLGRWDAAAALDS